jgi:RimJ/RimL family protein N-acetyltransferase
MTEAGEPARIETRRLVLRPWRDEDAAPFAAVNADPRVMEFFPAPLTREQSDGLIARFRASLAAHGFGPLAVEEKGSRAFVGYVGLSQVPFVAPFTPAIEIGWRLARDAWGEGYATEAAAAVLHEAFARHRLGEVVSFTAEWNRRSRRVMEKIGMRHDPAGDFLHPRIAAGHKLARHVLYRIGAPGGTAPAGQAKPRS